MNRDKSLAKTNLGSILNDVKEITYTDTFWDDARVAINALKLSGTKPPPLGCAKYWLLLRVIVRFEEELFSST